MLICPECQAGKHGNCDGFAGIDDDDMLLACKCQVCGRPAE